MFIKYLLIFLGAVSMIHYSAFAVFGEGEDKVLSGKHIKQMGIPLDTDFKDVEIEFEGYNLSISGIVTTNMLESLGSDGKIYGYSNGCGPNYWQFFLDDPGVEIDDPTPEDPQRKKWVGGMSGVIDLTIKKLEDSGPCPKNNIPISDSTEVGDVSTDSTSMSCPTVVPERTQNLHSPQIKQCSVSTYLKKTHHVYYDINREVWIGMELLTPDNIGWWKKRLGMDAQMQFRTQVDEEYERIGSIDKEELDLNTQAQEKFCKAMGCENVSTSLYPQWLGEAEEFMRMGDPDWGSEFLESVYEHRLKVCEGQNKDYLGAWRGFKYNVDNYQDAPTWVAYVSSKPLTGPLYKTVDTGSPDIRMAMTIKGYKPFYSPLGIYASPIARLLDSENNSKYRRLSLLLHSSVARFMREIDPKIKYMIVRPLAGMKYILEKSGLSFSSSSGVVGQNPELPQVLFAKFTREREGISFGNNPWALVDPHTNRIYQMKEDHWFAKSPFLGGIHDRQILTKFPFITIDCKALAAHKS